MKQRTTRQLSTTLEVLSSCRDHPTAEQIFERVRRVLPRISLGTVYRNLDKLYAQGRARLVRVRDGATRYDATVYDHDHFVCEACGAVFDAPRLALRPCRPSLEEAGFVVRSETTALYGLCAACARVGERGVAAQSPSEIYGGDR